MGEGQHDASSWPLPPGRPAGARRWRTLTFLAALRCDRIDAPCAFDAPINGRSFLAYVEQMFVSAL
jgi:hypothetical protein